MPDKVVAFFGKKRSGKSSAASILSELCYRKNIDYNVDSFAREIRSIVKDLFDISTDVMVGEKNDLIDIYWNNLPWNIRMKYSNEYRPVDLFEFKSFAKKPRIGRMSLRELLQVLGTDVFRNMFYKDVWVDYLLRFHKNTSFLIIDDGRFENEFRKIKEIGGICVHMTRNLPDNDKHESENEKFHNCKFDYEFSNNGTWEDLILKIEPIFYNYVCNETEFFTN